METDLNDVNETIIDTSCLFSPLLQRNRLTNNVIKKKFQDLSITLLPDELLQDQTFTQSYLSRTNVNSFNDTTFNLKRADAETENIFQNTLDNLYMKFFEVCQTHHNDPLINIKDLSTTCLDTLQVLKELSNYQSVDVQEKVFIESEYNTWCLLHTLYSDRLQTQTDYELPQYFGYSEKLCALNLFLRDSLLRESQLVIDWLEAACVIRDDGILHFQHITSGWENTLHQLKSKETTVFKSSREIVTTLDPDAQHYQKLPLHDLDMDDEKRLCQRVFQEIRCGRLSEAQEVCIECGHAWKAGQLEGWRLHHDAKKVNDNSNDENNEVCVNKETSDLGDTDEDVDDGSEGNEIRDIWKLMAFEYCTQPNLNVHEKAAIGAYCGNLLAMLAVGQNYEDDLWAYMKVMVDIRVESELRDCVNKKYKPLPEEYWEQRMSLTDIFLKLEASRKQEISHEATKVIRIIQKHIILDEIEAMFNVVDQFLEDNNVTTQFLRFLVHLVLFLEHIGTTTRRDVVEKLLEFYVKRLSDMNETQLLAFYVSRIKSQAQINLYAAHLESILDKDDRGSALTYAEANGLDVYAITKLIVENIRRKPHELEECGELQAKLTENDELKISSLDWLLYYESQRLEALIQSNALIFTFLTLKKLDAAQLAFNKIPANTVEYILSEENLSDDINQVIKEHLSYKVYLDAERAFNSWFKQFNMKPLPPEGISENAQFTEKVAYQHRISQYKAETERWKLTMSHLTKTTKTFLYNVLLFPEGGWLCGTKDGEFLRSICIPECVLLLYNVLSESNLHEECVQLADVLASEKYGLYKVYQDDNLGEILMKITSCSMALLKEKKDPFGNPSTF